MENKKRALGRGLEQLFNDEGLNFDTIENSIIEEAKTNDQIVEIDLSELRANPYQPRKVFDGEKLEELANSIREHGVFQPIIIKKSAIKGYEIIAGERRVKAATMAGLTTIPAIVRDFTDEQMMEIALLENLQRENLNAIEEAMAYRNLINSLALTQEALATKLGKSRVHVTNMLGLLNLPEEVKDMIVEGKISMSHARVLSKIENKADIITLANKVINENLNVRELEQLAQSGQIEKVHKLRKREKNTEYSYVENLMCDKLGTRVKINKNKINISFSNINDLNRILEILNINE